MLVEYRMAVRHRVTVTLVLLLLLLPVLMPSLPTASGQAARPSLPATPSPSLATPSPNDSPVACTDPCLIRFDAGTALDDALALTGLRPSLSTDTAVWVGGTPADLGQLVELGAEPGFIMDATPSLMLYGVTQPSRTSDRSPIEAFGTILDAADLTSIVAAPVIPAEVVGLTSGGFQVEKLAPYVPAGTPLLTPGVTAALPDVAGVAVAFPDLSTDNLDQSITDLESSGATPGDLGSRYFSSPGNAMAAEYLFLRFAASGLTVWFEDYVASTGILSVNVVAEIPGTDPSQVYAAFAHMDTISQDAGGNTEAPGALDNATGLAILLENARVLAGYRLQYPMRFVALNGEEIGLEGANAFGARHAELGTPFVAGINVDGIGSAYGQRVLYLNASDTSTFIQDIMLEQYDAFGFALNVQPRQNPAIISDETPLTLYGIPTLLVAGVIYGDPLVHCACDTIDGVDLDYVRATGRLVLVTAAVLTAGPD